MIFTALNTPLDINAYPSLPSSVLALLETPELEVYLTGSRFFGSTHSLSDWDFVCGPLTKSKEATLLSLDFTLEEYNPSKVYPTKLFGGVVRVFSRSGDNATHEAHVLEVSNLAFRHKVQRTIKHFFANGYSNKSTNSKAIWTMAEMIVAQKLALLRIFTEIDTGYPDISSSIVDDSSPDYDEENDWEDCWEWVMESYAARDIRENMTRLRQTLEE
jgi:hypothetical protein